jgi:uncharacterized membrane protein YkoI
MKLPVAWLVLGVAGFAFAEPQKVDADKVPAAAMKTLQRIAGGLAPASVEREEIDGLVVYEGTFSPGTPEEHTVTAAEDGTLIGVDVTLPETPAAVKKTIESLLAGGTLDGIEKNTEDSEEITYDVDFTTKAGKERSMSIAENGTLLSIEVSLEETPAAVQEAIKGQTAEGKLDEINKSLDGEVITYDVQTTTKEGKARNFTLNASGSLDSLEIGFAETTAAAQKTIRNRIGAGRIVRVAETFENQKLSGYEVDGVVAGKSITFKVGLKGKFQGLEE